MLQTLIIDNYDSFTLNLYHYFAQINELPPIVVYNDASWDEVQSLLPFVDNIVVSPGPGSAERPSDFRICRHVLCQTRIPVLGVCLGLQGLACVFGGKIIHVAAPEHGTTCPIFHNNHALFHGIPQGFNAVRYNSLLVDPDSIPDCLELCAWSASGEIMGLCHKQLQLLGVQFHPESICTEYGRNILQNFSDGCKIVRKGEVDQKKLSSLLSHGLRAISSHVSHLLCSPSDIPQTQTYVLHTHETQYRASDAVFPLLFAHKPYAFWLDSSKICTDNRFSFMGSIDGPLSSIYRYDMNQSTVYQEFPHTQHKKQIELPTAQTDDFLGFLNTELLKFKEYVVQSHGKPPAVLHSGTASFLCGMVGYLGYEMKGETQHCQYADVASQEPTKRHTDPIIGDVPQSMYMFADRVIVFDHLEETCHLLCLTHNHSIESTRCAHQWLESTHAALLATAPSSHSDDQVAGPYCPHQTVEFSLRQHQSEYCKNIEKCLEYIRDGESYEICLTTQLQSRCTVDPFSLYMSLRKSNPAPYASYLSFSSLKIVSSSPERFVRISPNRVIECKPIKGTLPRGANDKEDAELSCKLQNSKKDRAENLMIVDLIRNDLESVCEPGSVCCPKLMVVESFATVHQLVSTVRGKLCPQVHCTDAFRTTFPPGSMTGAPKLRSTEKLALLENGPRSVYSGCIGYFSINDCADSSVVIRTAVCTPNGISIGAGGAIVSLSDVHAEFEEMLLKAKALLLQVTRGVCGCDATLDQLEIKGSDPVAMPNYR